MRFILSALVLVLGLADSARADWSSIQLEAAGGTHIQVNYESFCRERDTRAHHSAYGQTIGYFAYNVWIEVDDARFTGRERVRAVFLPDSTAETRLIAVDLKHYGGNHFAGSLSREIPLKTLFVPGGFYPTPSAARDTVQQPPQALAIVVDGVWLKARKRELPNPSNFMLRMFESARVRSCYY